MVEIVTHFFTVPEVGVQAEIKTRILNVGFHEDKFSNIPTPVYSPPSLINIRQTLNVTSKWLTIILKAIESQFVPHNTYGPFQKIVMENDSGKYFFF